jgi:hypothetical protein
VLESGQVCCMAATHSPNPMGPTLDEAIKVRRLSGVRI